MDENEAVPRKPRRGGAVDPEKAKMIGLDLDRKAEYVPKEDLRYAMLERLREECAEQDQSGRYHPTPWAVYLMVENWIAALTLMQTTGIPEPDPGWYVRDIYSWLAALKLAGRPRRPDTEGMDIEGAIVALDAVRSWMQEQGHGRRGRSKPMKLSAWAKKFSIDDKTLYRWRKKGRIRLHPVRRGMWQADQDDPLYRKLTES